VQQSRHKSFEQNPCLIKISANKCRPLDMPSRLPLSKELITKEAREIESVYKHHSIVNKKDLQHVGRVSSGQQRKVHQTNRTSGGTFSDFHKTSESAHDSAGRDCSLLK
jgi:hypothetical protein